MSQRSGGRIADEALQEALRRLADHLEPKLDELVDELHQHYLTEIPGYVNIPADPARQSARETLHAWILQIRSGQLPEDGDRTDIAAQATT